MIDYAYPTMMAEKALKDLHEAMLMKRHDDAVEAGLEAIKQACLALQAVAVMAQKAQDDAR